MINYTQIMILFLLKNIQQDDDQFHCFRSLQKIKMVQYHNINFCDQGITLISNINFHSKLYFFK